MNSKIESLARLAFADFLVSPERKKFNLWHGVRKWKELMEYNKENFRFVARWHLEKIGAEIKNYNTGGSKSKPITR
jgi:hypothetical protein